MTIGGATTVIVHELTKNGKALALRDIKGTPAWHEPEAEPMKCCEAGVKYCRPKNGTAMKCCAETNHKH